MFNLHWIIDIIFWELIAHHIMKLDCEYIHRQNTFTTFSLLNQFLPPVLPKKSGFLTPVGDKVLLFKSPSLITDLRGEERK